MKYEDTKGRCHQCGAPFVAQTKWNNGNPTPIPFATCDCAEKAFETALEARSLAVKKRRQDDE